MLMHKLINVMGLQTNTQKVELKLNKETIVALFRVNKAPTSGKSQNP